MSGKDLFGDVPEVLAGAPFEGKHHVTPNGYVMPPGTGPDGETCGSCKHLCRFKTSSKSWAKCGANRGKWTCSRRTDIMVRAPACSKWQRLDESITQPS